jgi:hypothetical protein
LFGAMLDKYLKKLDMLTEYHLRYHL